MIKKLLFLIPITVVSFVCGACASTQLQNKLTELNSNQAVMNENMNVLRDEVKQMGSQEIRRTCNITRDGKVYSVPMATNFECQHIGMILQKILTDIKEEAGQRSDPDSNTDT